MCTSPYARVLHVDLGRALADSLQQLRREAGLTQARMARTLGVSRPTLTRLESMNQNVTLRTLGRLCSALRCDPGDLFHPGRLRRRARRKGPLHGRELI
jgi:transcriptional regulator with XRE-family HTH domain